MATVKKLKKAQDGSSIGEKLAAKTAERNTPGTLLRQGQRDRLTRIEKSNPDRAAKVASRMVKRAKANSPEMKKGGKVSKAQDGKKVAPKKPYPHNESGLNKENDMREMAEAGGLGGREMAARKAALKAKTPTKAPKTYKSGGKVAKTPAQKKFAALAAPKNKITFADKLAGIKKKKK